MAKISALTAENQVLKNIGESVVVDFSALTTIQQYAFDALNRAMLEISMEDSLQQLETAGSITYTLNTDNYAYPSDFDHIDIYSMITADGLKRIQFLNADEFDQKFPAGSTNRSGYPDWFTIKFNKIYFDRYAGSVEAGKFITYRYSKIPALYSVVGDTCYIPESWDRTLLCDYATWLTMSYMGHPEVMQYWAKVFGEPGDKKPEGLLTKFKRKYTQPFGKISFSAVL